MFNRSSMDEAPGGDVVQLQKTRDALQQEGVHVEVATPHNMPSGEAFDVVHLFNLQTSSDTMIGLNWATARGIPTVLSPIFWDLSDGNFARASATRKPWRFMRRLLGRALAGATYKTWQGIKAPWQSEWQQQRLILRRSHRVLPNANAEASAVRDHFNLNGSWDRSVRVVPNGVDASVFGEIAATSSIVDSHKLEGCILQVGWIGENKNQLALIEALYDEPIRIAFIGQASPYELRYAEECQERALERGNVIFVGPVEQRELPAIYASAAAHVLPSWRETPGLATLEAASTGCRVVSTSIGTAHEYLGEKAWYCHPATRDSIRGATLSALDSSPPMGLREHVLGNFTWDRAARMTLATYQEVISGINPN